MGFLFLANMPQVGFSEEVSGLSGKYKGYNVILIILDALRPDHLSCYGYAKHTSPNIDALAQEGILFSKAFSQASITLPSVASIFTSTYPYSHRMVYILKDKIPDTIDTMAEVLNIYGYAAVWFGVLDDPHSGSAKGLLKGFNEKYDLVPFKKPEDNERIFRWIRNCRKDPFFMTIHSYALHEQFFPFERFDNEFSRNMPKDFLDLMNTFDKRCWDNIQEMLKNESKKTGTVLGGDWVNKNLRHGYSPGAFSNLLSLAGTSGQKIMLERIRNKLAIALFESLDKKQRSCFLSLLDSAVYQIDKDMVARLVNELKEVNLYDKTIIIITADHGNLYGEHGKFGHGYYLYDEVMRVPLILHLPDVKRGRIVKELVQSIDIFPTVLDLLAIPIPRQSQGINLVGLIEGKKTALHNEYVFCEPRGDPLGPFAIRSKKWKLMQRPLDDEILIDNDVLDGFDFQLFDLQKDPHELHNIIKEKPKAAATLKKRLSLWKDGLVIYQQGESDFLPGLQEETRERIKKTGYW